MSLPLGASVASSVKWATPNYTREGRRKCLSTGVDLLSGETGHPWTASFHFTQLINDNNDWGQEQAPGALQSQREMSNEQFLYPGFRDTQVARSAGTATPSQGISHAPQTT